MVSTPVYRSVAEEVWSRRILVGAYEASVLPTNLGEPYDYPNEV